MMRSGALFPLPQWVLPTSEKGSSSWPTPLAQEAKHGDVTQWELETDHAATRDSLRVQVAKQEVWPTPLSSDYKNMDSSNQKSLSNQVKMWPTPRAGNPGSRPNGKGGKILNEEVLIAEGLRTRGAKQEMWPTPTTKGYGHGSEGQYQNLYKKMIQGEITKEEMEIMTATKLENHRSYEKMQKRWPTPKANKVHPMITEKNREKLANRNKSNLEEVVAGRVGNATGQLNPTWVEWLMGFPTGWTDLKDSETP